MPTYFSPEAEIERMRRENVRDTEMRLVILGDGLGGANTNLYADDNNLWVRDTQFSVPYQALAGNGPTPEINKQVWIKWESGPEKYRVHMSDPGHMASTGRSMHLENASDPHNQFHRTEQLLPLLSLPIGDGLANVQGYIFTYNGQYGEFKGTSGVAGTHVDLIALQPSTPGEHCYCLVVFSPTEFFDSANPIKTYLSTPQTGSLDSTDIQECIDQMLPGERRIKLYRLDAGATEYRGHADDRDVRDWINESLDLYYQTIQEDGIDAPQQPKLNFVPSGSVDVTVTDNPTDGSTDVLIEAVAGAGTDTTAIHDNVANEIHVITQKTVPESADELVIEDSAASWAKKRITVGSLKQGYMLLQDQKTSGTGGGSYTAPNEQVRTLNTTVGNTITGASLLSNQITLPAGTYQWRSTSPAQNINLHQAYLYNVTDAAVVQRGTQNFSAGNIQTISEVTAYFTITSTKVFELRHRGQTSNAGSSAALGVAGSFGTEVYSVVEIAKI